MRNSGRYIGRRLRRGLTLIELMVAMAIIGIVSAAAIPTMAGVFDVEQRGAAREIAQMYRFLLSEAALRNVTFRVAFDLDGGSWKIEVGDPNSLVFGSAEELEKWEEEQEKQRDRFTKPDPATDPAAETTNRFSDLEYPGVDTKAELPPNSSFAWVYTPQYPEPQRPSDEDAEDLDETEHRVVYSYVYPNGTADFTGLRIVDTDDPEDGYTVLVEPMSGRTDVEAEDIDPVARMSWVPSEAPTIR